MLTHSDGWCGPCGLAGRHACSAAWTADRAGSHCPAWPHPVMHSDWRLDAPGPFLAPPTPLHPAASTTVSTSVIFMHVSHDQAGHASAQKKAAKIEVGWGSLGAQTGKEGFCGAG